LRQVLGFPKMIESEEILVVVARFDLTRPIHGDASAFEAGAPEADRSSMRLDNSIGSIRFNETNRGTFAVSLLWGKFGGLHAYGGTFSYIVPLPNIFLTHLFSKLGLKRKDFPEVARPT
jgi:hypothetical protein